MLIGGDNISNDVARAFLCFSMFVYICALSHFALIGGIWQLSRREATGELEREQREYVVTSSPSFSRPAARAPRRACSQARGYSLRNWEGQQYCHLTRS